MIRTDLLATFVWSIIEQEKTRYTQTKRRVSCYSKLNSDNDRFPHVVGQGAEIYCNGEWKRGKIVEGYRFKDGVVTIETPEGEQIWCGEDRKDLYRPVND